MTDVARKTRKEVIVKAGTADFAFMLAEVENKGWRAVEAKKVYTLPTFKVLMHKKQKFYTTK